VDPLTPPKMIPLIQEKTKMIHFQGGCARYVSRCICTCLILVVFTGLIWLFEYRYRWKKQQQRYVNNEAIISCRAADDDATTRG